MANSDNKPGNKNEHVVHHVTPLSVYNRVFGALIVGTILTVAVSYVDFGSANTLIAMLIATVKAMLVILFFMGLKYEGQENNVTFFCSFVFLVIFVGLSSADLFYRIEASPVKVDASEMQQGGAPVDVAKLAKSSPESVAKGKALFAQQCVTCHGPEGKGDGPAAAALVPKPRNFTSGEGWKYGRSTANIFKTLTNGSPGTPMPPFSGLAPEERFALAHFVQTLGPAAPDSKPEELSALQKELGGGAKPRLSIEKAMDKLDHEWAAAHPAEKR